MQLHKEASATAVPPVTVEPSVERSAEPVAQTAASAGARWVDRYLLPLIAQRLRKPAGVGLQCLQIEPDDAEEAVRLRQHGHACDIVFCERDARAGADREQPPLIADPARLPLDADRYDLVLCGVFGRITRSAERRRAIAGEWARVCKRGGAVLLTVGNRRCPVDLSGNAPRLHGPWNQAAVTLEEMEQIFVHEGGFTALAPLSLAGHFGGSRAHGAGGIAVRCVNWYLRWSTRPDHRQVYTSLLNPMLSLWIER